MFQPPEEHLAQAAFEHLVSVLHSGTICRGGVSTISNLLIRNCTNSAIVVKSGVTLQVMNTIFVANSGMYVLVEALPGMQACTTYHNVTYTAP
jgi:hypothetical protein